MPHVHIIGRNQLQNVLLGSHLKEHADIDCSCAAALEDLLPLCEDVTGKEIVLIDCFSLSRALLLSMLEQVDSSRLVGRLPALFNLGVGLTIEPAAIRVGFRGFFYQDDQLPFIVKGIRALLNDEYWISRRLLADFLATHNVVEQHTVSYPELSQREAEILGLLVQGGSNRALADQLFISIPTVKTHLCNIFRKINVTNRLQAIRWAENKDPRHQRSP